MNFSWLSPRRRPIVVAHRGSSGTAPENTLTAFRLAREDGADAIELDVHLSGDGQVVVIHDSNLDRTTNGKGPVRNFSLLQLKKYNAAIGCGNIFRFETIPTLEEVFVSFDCNIGINVEIKGEHTEAARHEILRKCVALVHKYKLYDNVLISSFSSKAVKEIGLLDPRILRGLLYDPLHHVFRSPVAYAKSLGIQYLIMSRMKLHKKTVTVVHAKNMLVGEFTVNTERQAKRSLRYGIDAIITNYPSEIFACLRRRK